MAMDYTNNQQANSNNINTMGDQEDDHKRFRLPHLKILLHRYQKHILWTVGGILVLTLLVSWAPSPAAQSTMGGDTSEKQQTQPPEYVSDYAHLSQSPTDLRIDPKWLMAVSLNAAKAAGDEIVSIQKSGKLGQSSKGGITADNEKVDDPLTQADLASHRIMMGAFQTLIPGISVVSEEKDASKSSLEESKVIKAVDDVLRSSRRTMGIGEMKRVISSKALLSAQNVVVWLDPLDATKEYTEDLTNYVTVMIGIALKGKPIGGVVHYPFSGRTLWGWTSGHQGVRNDTSEALWNGDEELLSKGAQKPPETAQKDSDKPVNDKLRVIVSRSHAGSIRDHLQPLTNTYADLETTPAGGAGYKIGEVLADRQDAYMHTSGIKKWDLCPGDALLRAQRNKDRSMRKAFKTYSLHSIGGIRTWKNDEISYGLEDEIKVGGIYGARSRSVDGTLIETLPEIELNPSN